VLRVERRDLLGALDDGVRRAGHVAPDELRLLGGAVLADSDGSAAGATGVAGERRERFGRHVFELGRDGIAPRQSVR
jgi:hypothetical protein